MKQLPTWLIKLIMEGVATMCIVAAVLWIPLAYYDYLIGNKSPSFSIELLFLYAELISIAGAWLLYHGSKTIDV